LRSLELDFKRCVALGEVACLGRGLRVISPGLQDVLLSFGRCSALSAKLQTEFTSTKDFLACFDWLPSPLGSPLASPLLDPLGSPLLGSDGGYFAFRPEDRLLSRDLASFEEGGLNVTLKGIVANRASARKKTASSKLSAKLDRVSGLANQRIIGNYAVLEDYTKDKVVGIGISGEVWKARLLPNPKWTEAQKDVVLKSLKKRGLSDRKLAQLIRECEVGLVLDHPLICRLLRVYDTAEDVTLVLEYCDGGDLFDRIARAGRFTEKAAQLTCVQMLSAVKYLRAQHVVHRDIKLENWLYATNDPRSPVCLTDFGFATYFDQEVDPPLTEMMGSSYYIAPEVFHQSYGIECDVWSTGVIAYMLLSGAAPFSGKDQEQTFIEIVNKTLEFPPEQWKDVSNVGKDFITRVLTRDTKKRLSPTAALEHAWLKELKDKRFRMTDDVRNESMEMLLNLARETSLRRAVMISIGMGAQTKTYRDARRQFLDLDLENTGTITQRSFIELSRVHGIDPEEATQLFRRLNDHKRPSVSINDCRELEYSEFVAAYLNVELVEDDDTILRAFNIFDVDRDGYVSKKDLEKVFGNKDCVRMLEEVGCREPKGMDLPHFKAMVLQQDTDTPPGSPSKKRIELDDNDFGGGVEVKRNKNLCRTPSLANAELQRSISMIRPAFRMTQTDTARLETFPEKAGTQGLRDEISTSTSTSTSAE
jgi:calcium-dependent protein kinase